MIAAGTAENAGTSSMNRPAGPLRAFADLIDRRPALVLPVWIASYFAVLWRAAHRPLWYDELFTYYVSMSPTWERFVGSIRNVDLNPPLSYLFVRASIVLFGNSPFAVRLPSMLGFLAASLVVYVLVTRRLGGALGLASLGIFWSSSLSRYAAEARPYGLLLGFFSIAMLCWWRAADVRRWTMWHAGLTLAIGAMFLTHCYSPPFAAAIAAAELVRTIVSRRADKIDKRLWASLLIPFSILPLYIPLVRNARGLIYPPAFAATLITIPKIYLAILAPLLPSIGAIVLIFLAGHGRGRRVRLDDIARPHEIAFVVAAFLAPLVTMSYCIWSAAPFWPRYAMGALLGCTLMLTALLALATKRNSSLTAGAAALILILFCVTKAGTGPLVEPYENTSTGYRTISPELPFVTASGLTFLEMDHREQPGFLSRLYYLTDHDAALRYHTNIFEGMPILRQWFPIRSNVASYRDFIVHNRRFLVLATRGFPEDWLLLKLQQDGAQIHLLQDVKTGYRDRELYEVTLRK